MSSAIINPHIQLYAKYSDAVKIVKCKETIASNSSKVLPHDYNRGKYKVPIDRSNSSHYAGNILTNDRDIFPDLFNKSCEAVTVDYHSNNSDIDENVLRPTPNNSEEVNADKKSRNKKKSQKANNEKLEKLEKLKEFNKRVYEKNARKVKLQQKRKREAYLANRRNILTIIEESRRKLHEKFKNFNEDLSENPFSIKNMASGDSQKIGSTNKASTNLTVAGHLTREKKRRGKSYKAEEHFNKKIVSPYKIHQLNNDKLHNSMDENGNYNLLLFNKNSGHQKENVDDSFQKRKVTVSRPKSKITDKANHQKLDSNGSSPSQTELNFPHSIYDLIQDCHNTGNNNFKCHVTPQSNLSMGHLTEYHFSVGENEYVDKEYQNCSNATVSSGRHRNHSKYEKNENFQMMITKYSREINNSHIPPLKTRESFHCSGSDYSNIISKYSKSDHPQLISQIDDFDDDLKSDQNLYDILNGRSKEAAILSDIDEENSDESESSSSTADHSQRESYSIDKVIKNAVEMNLKLLKFIEFNEEEMDLWNENDDLLKEIRPVSDNKGKNKKVKRNCKIKNNSNKTIKSEIKNEEILASEYKQHDSEFFVSDSTVESHGFLIYHKDEIESLVESIKSSKLDRPNKAKKKKKIAPKVPHSDSSKADSEFLNYPYPVSVNINLHSHKRSENSLKSQSSSDPPPLDFKPQTKYHKKHNNKHSRKSRSHKCYADKNQPCRRTGRG